MRRLKIFSTISESVNSTASLRYKRHGVFYGECQSQANFMRYVLVGERMSKCITVDLQKLCVTNGLLKIPHRSGNEII